MIVVELGPVEAAHLAMALRGWRAQCRVDRLPFPVALADLEAVALRRGRTVHADAVGDGSLEVVHDHPVAILLTYTEAGAVLGVSRDTVKRLVASGSLPRVKVGAAARIHRDDVEQYAQSLRGAAPQAIYKEAR